MWLFFQSDRIRPGDFLPWLIIGHMSHMSHTSHIGHCQSPSPDSRILCFPCLPGGFSCHQLDQLRQRGPNCQRGAKRHSLELQSSTPCRVRLELGMAEPAGDANLPAKDFDRLLTVTQNSCDGGTIKPNDLCFFFFTFSIPTWPSYDLMRCGVMTGFCGTLIGVQDCL